MKRAFKFYAIGWSVLVAAWNLMIFALPDELTRASRFDGAFTAGYALMMLSFIGQLICACFAFREENAKKFFYHIPLITISGSATILSVLVGGLCMVVAQIPYWVGMVLCVLMLACSAISVLKAKVTADIVGNMDDRIKAQTAYMHSLVADAQVLITKASADPIKAELKKVYEAVRYSDPVSKAELADLEEQLTFKFDALSEAVQEGDFEHVQAAQKAFMILLEERNQKCKLLK